MKHDKRKTKTTIDIHIYIDTQEICSVERGIYQIAELHLLRLTLVS